MAFSQPEHIIEQLQLRPDMVVADMGAGTGAFTIAAARRLSRGGKVIAVEVQKDLLATLEQNVRDAGLVNVEAVWGDIENVNGTKITDSTIDVVIASNILFQVEDKDGFIDEIRRILAPGGKVFVLDWAESFGGMGPRPEDIIVSDTAKALFEEHRFTIKTDVVVGDHHYGFIADK